MDFRMKILSSVGCRCTICGQRSIANDVHHIFYPKDLRTTSPSHVRVLCRRCHVEVHELFHPKDVKSLVDGRALFAFVKHKIKEKLKLSVMSTPASEVVPNIVRDINYDVCSCCHGPAEGAYYNVFKFDKRFPCHRHQFMLLCSKCGDLMFEYLKPEQYEKQHHIFARRRELMPIIRNRLTSLLS